MAKNNIDIDELNFSFGSAKPSTTIPKPIKKTTDATTIVTTPPKEVISEPIVDKAFKQPIPIPEGSSDSLDTRYLINSVDDITAHTMWNTMSNGMYSNVYQGMQVYVKSTKDVMVYVGPTSTNGVLTKDATNLDYWVTIKTTANMDKMITSVTINNKYVSIMDKEGTKLNIDIAGTKVPYKDGYISLLDLDKIREMMGDNTIQINSAYPDVTNVINNIYDRLTLYGNDLDD